MQTIFRDVGTTSILFSRNSTIALSEEFIDCANEPLTHYFENVTELHVSRHILFAKVPDAGMPYNSGTESFITLLLFVNHHFNPVTIARKSLSERIYTFRCGSSLF